MAAYCILAAIIGREKTGKGQYIDISMMDGAMAWLCMYAGKYFADGKSPRPSSELLTGQFACYNVYKTKDGRYMSLGALEPQFWSAFCKAVGREDLIKVQFAPGKFSDTPAELKTPPPTLGEHTEEILKELGMTDEKIAALAKEKII